MFRVHDIDGDGFISVDDLRLTTELLAGSNVSDEVAVSMAKKTIEAAGGDVRKGLTLREFEHALSKKTLDMTLEFSRWEPTSC